MSINVFCSGGNAQKIAEVAEFSKEAEIYDVRAVAHLQGVYKDIIIKVLVVGMPFIFILFI